MLFKVCFYCFFKFILSFIHSSSSYFLPSSESIRVERFREIANAADEGDEDEDDAIEELSVLMSKSHQSLKTLYECSHPNLEELIGISKEFGVGARLTGAGWGGCIVALADSITTCDRYISTLKDNYYDRIHHSKNLVLDEVVFATVSWSEHFKPPVVELNTLSIPFIQNRSHKTEPRFSSQSSLKSWAILEIFSAILEIFDFLFHDFIQSGKSWIFVISVFHCRANNWVQMPFLLLFIDFLDVTFLHFELTIINEPNT